jgi:hypothetical protein
MKYLGIIINSFAVGCIFLALLINPNAYYLYVLGVLNIICIIYCILSNKYI